LSWEARKLIMTPEQYATEQRSRPVIRSLPAGEWLTYKEAAAYCSVSLATVKRWVKVGHLKRYHPPKQPTVVRVRKSEIDLMFTAVASQGEE